jgi:hypothetical protein
LITIIPRVQFDPENSKEPITFTGSLDESVTLDPSNRVIKNFIFKSVELYDDRWDFFKESLKISYADIDRV